MVGLFGKSELFAFYMVWIHSIFHGVVLQCLLLMIEMEFFWINFIISVLWIFLENQHDVQIMSTYMQHASFVLNIM